MMTNQESPIILSEWYELISKSQNLLQADILEGCPIFIPPKDLQFSENDLLESENDLLETEFSLGLQDVIIMSQSCDMESGKKDMWFVILCPLWKLSFASENFDIFKSNFGKEECRRGNMAGYHMLSGCEHELWKQDVLIVSFREIYSLPIDFVRQFAEDKPTRARLRSPYREHLAQAFARYFMRVGLPTNIPSFNTRGAEDVLINKLKSLDDDALNRVLGNFL